MQFAYSEKWRDVSTAVWVTIAGRFCPEHAHGSRSTAHNKEGKPTESHSRMWAKAPFTVSLPLFGQTLTSRWPTPMRQGHRHLLLTTTLGNTIKWINVTSLISCRFMSPYFRFNVRFLLDIYDLFNFIKYKNISNKCLLQFNISFLNKLYNDELFINI